MQECGQPPADLVGEMVSCMYPTHFEIEIICNLLNTAPLPQILKYDEHLNFFYTQPVTGSLRTYQRKLRKVGMPRGPLGNLYWCSNGDKLGISFCQSPYNVLSLSAREIIKRFRKCKWIFFQLSGVYIVPILGDISLSIIFWVLELFNCSKKFCIKHCHCKVVISQCKIIN